MMQARCAKWVTKAKHKCMADAANKIELEPAYVLHARAYRETSLIVELFTASHGRVGAVARGARRPKSALRGLLNPFQPLRVSCVGRGELATLTHAEYGGTAAALSDQYVLAGFYVNELLLKLMERADPHPDLFVHYGGLVAVMAERGPLEAALRTFELQLLREIGYELEFATDGGSGDPLAAGAHYQFTPEHGPSRVSPDEATGPVHLGADLLAIGRLDFSEEGSRRAAKHILRDVLNYYLGDRTLHTRRVAAAMKR